MLVEDNEIAKKSCFDKIDTIRQFPNGLLSEIILTIADKCNRHCGYCPHGNGYVSPHVMTDINMSVMHKICDDVGTNYDGYFSLCGFGEPTLNNKLIDIITLIANYCPNAKMWIYTNGDRLEMLNKIPYLAQLVIQVSKHDKTWEEDRYQLLASSSENKIIIHDILSNNISYFNNRASNISLSNIDVTQLPLNRCCNIPFYKMSVDINGDVLQCCSDWKRENVLGNVLSTNVYDVWNNEKYKQLRMSLMSNNRKQLLCAKCSALGTLTGNEHVMQWKNIYQMA